MLIIREALPLFNLCPKTLNFLFRWCAEGGKLICCDYCNNAFCKKCILRNLGRKELSVITDENSKWHCYVCRSEPLQDLVSKCHSVMENQEHALLKQRKPDKMDKPDKPDKTEERESKQHKNKPVKEHKAVVNGKEHVEGSGTMTFSYKKLQVPKELIKKTKKLVETTTGLNNTFIQFIQQATDEQEDKSIRYRHLKAFKAVLADLKKAHSALEAALGPEFKNMEVQNGEEEQPIVRKSADVVVPVENDHMDNASDAVDESEATEEPVEEPALEVPSVEESALEVPSTEEPALEEPAIEEEEADVEEADVEEADVEEADVEEADVEEADVDQDNEQDEENDQGSNDIEMKDQTEVGTTKKKCKSEVCDDGLVSTGEMSLDHDIMSVPPSVPEELFQMVESLADSTMLSKTDTDVVTGTEKDTENTKSNGNSTDSQRPQPKVKNLIVKLTPVPVVTTCGSRSSRTKNREKAEETQKKLKEEDHEEEEGKEEEAKDDAADTVDGTNSPPPSRRSSRVKTTPLRKQTENKGKEESSDSESEEDGKEKAKSSKKSRNTKKEDGKQTTASEKKTMDSDSDEVPNILLEKAAAEQSTDEEQGSTGAKKRLFKLNNTSREDTDKMSKRKRKSESSDSDLENKSKRLSKKKKKRKGSDSSNSDSDQEKEKKSKLGTAKRRSSRVKKTRQDEAKEDDRNSPEMKVAERKRSYEKKRRGRSSKSASKLQLSSSEEEDEEQQQADSEEDSDAQKIKPIVEDNIVGGGVPFHQSSGKSVQFSICLTIVQFA